MELKADMLDLDRDHATTSTNPLHGVESLEEKIEQYRRETNPLHGVERPGYLHPREIEL